MKLRPLRDPIHVELEHEIEATNRRKSIPLRLKALMRLKRRSKRLGCDGAFLLVHYELLGIYMRLGDDRRARHVQKVISRLSPKVIKRRERAKARLRAEDLRRRHRSVED